MRARLTRFLSFLALALLLGGLITLSLTRDRSRDLLELAGRAMEQGRTDEALRLYRIAYERTGDEAILRTIEELAKTPEKLP